MSEIPTIDPLRERLDADELEHARTSLSRGGIGAVVAGAHASLSRAVEARDRLETFARMIEAEPRARVPLVEGYLRETVKDASTLRADLRALRRDPHTFDLPALAERVAKLASTSERFAEASLALARKGLASFPANNVDLEQLFDLARFPGQWSRRVEALGLLEEMIPSLSAGERIRAADAARRLFDREEHHWVQPAALATLAAIDNLEGLALARERLTNPGEGDDLLVRERIVDLAARIRRDGWDELVGIAAADRSDHVRLLVARTERELARLRILARHDASPKVRASAITALARRHGTAAEDVYAESLETDASPLVVEIVAANLLYLARNQAMTLRPRILAALHAAAGRADITPQARARATDCVAELSVLTNVILRPVHDVLVPIVQKTPVGGGTRITSSALQKMDDENLGRILCVLAQGDHALGVDRTRQGIVLHRGEPRTFAAWRALFEARHPSPSKRQAFTHTWARKPHGTLRAPPGGLAELTATRVPGERVVLEKAGDWGRHLPMIDDLLSVVGFRAHRVAIVSSGGTTTLVPPASLAARLRAWAVLTARYAELVDVRRRSLESHEPATQGAFIAEIYRRTQIAILYTPHLFGMGRSRFALPAPSELASATTQILPDPVPTQEADAATRYAIPLLGGAGASEMFRELSRYALSPEGNRLPHVAAYTFLMLGVLMARSAVIRHAIDRDRKAMPIVVGGWGTRGKSGTERLKAGLFQGLGHEVLVKTTGCEAMFIHAVPGMTAREIFIYRPYDKATIWEQRDVLSLARRLGAKVFLWECMALQPDLVSLLQHQWMRDDYSTITNAYPDHEDVQGPTGFDVATVISEFVPTKGHLFTAEDQMLPLLRDKAHERGTTLRVAGLAESELIADDLLARFPYQEHPRNIALVTMLARSLGIPAAVAIAEMADHVVPDLGVLKTYPTVPWNGRTLSFTNGMSANERTGALANWRRSGFDQHDPNAEPARWIVTVVNNRADRIARSEVFARFLVEDISAHRHFLIGTNVSGLVGFIDAALTRHLAAISPVKNLGGDAATRMETAGLRIERAFARLHVTRTDADSVSNEIAAYGHMPLSLPRLESLLAPAEPGEPYERALATVLASMPPEVMPSHRPFFASTIARRRAVRAVRAVLSRDLASNPERVDAVFAAAFRALFEESVIPLYDAALTGDQILDTIAKSIPPNAHADIMGVQNIKGTGLDFVYRWVSIDTVTRALAQIASPTREHRDEGLRALQMHDDFGLLDAAYAAEKVDEARAGDLERDELPYDAVLSRLRAIATARAARLTARRSASAGERVRAFIGKTFDYLDSIRRQRMARSLLTDLVAGRVSHAAAAIRMRDVVARAKGAWMTMRSDDA